MVSSDSSRLISKRSHRWILSAAALLVISSGIRAVLRVETSAAAGDASAALALKTVGYNMDYPGDWTDLPPFIDLMKNARAPIGSCSAADPECDRAAHLNLDAAGWLKSLVYRDDATRSYTDAVIYINTSGDRYDIGQRFAVTWDGLGSVSVDNGGDVQLDPGGRRLTFTLRTGNTSLRLRNIDVGRSGNYLRNIRVFRVSHEALLNAGRWFNPEMLSWLAPFGSVRFMDWMQSNSAGECSGGTRHGQNCYAVTNEDCGGGRCVMPGTWSERPAINQPSLISWGQYLNNAAPQLGTKVGGYPVEVMVMLANELNAHPHFNMPVAYTEAYVRAFAEIVRDNLKPGLVASVEYSNEVWNWQFPQANYAHQLGQRAWPNLASAWVQYAAGRTHDMCRIWKEVFATEEHRMRCLISPQTGWREMAPTVLDCPAWVASHPGQKNCTEYVDAINITGYFSGCLWHSDASVLQWLALGRETALARGFQQLEHGGLIADCDDHLDDTIADYGYFAGLARQRGLDLVAYEGGTHFSYSGTDPSVAQFLVDLARDPRMYDIYRRNFQGFWASGGSTFNAWGWVAPNDAWALADNATDFSHVKYKAISSLTSVAVPWRPKVLGCSLSDPPR